MYRVRLPSVGLPQRYDQDLETALLERCNFLRDMKDSESRG